MLQEENKDQESVPGSRLQKMKIRRENQEEMLREEQIMQQIRDSEEKELFKEMRLKQIADGKSQLEAEKQARIDAQQ